MIKSELLAEIDDLKIEVEKLRLDLRVMSRDYNKYFKKIVNLSKDLLRSERIREGLNMARMLAESKMVGAEAGLKELRRSWLDHKEVCKMRV